MPLFNQYGFDFQWEPFVECIMVPHLRVLTLEDTSALFSLISQNKPYLQEWFEWACSVDSESDTRNFIESSLKRYAQNKAFDVGIWFEDELVGVAGFHDINWNHKEVEIGYWISQTHQGQGLTSQAVQALMTYAFLEYKLNRIQIKCATHNLKSRTLAERLGFSFEGIEREGLLFRGRFFDVACYALLARDFHVTGEESYALLARNIRTP